jgi:hypothetical protein
MVRWPFRKKPFPFFLMGGVNQESTAFLAEFLHLTAGTNVASTAVFTSVSFGAPHSNRTLYGAFHTRIATGATVDAVTVGGVAATIHAQISQDFVAADELVCIFSANVPSGTSGDVVVTCSTTTTVNRLYLGLYRVLNQTGTIDDSDTVAVNANTTGTRTLDPTVVGGAVIAAATGAAEGDGIWTGPVETYDQEFAGHAATGANGALLTDLVDVTQDVDFSDAAMSDIAFVAVAFH